MKVGIVCVIALMTLITVSCTPRELPPQQLAQTATPSAQPITNWQQSWDDLVKAGKKEGIIVIYSGAGPDVRNELTKNFKEKYGISADWIIGRGAETEERVLREQSAGLFLADVYLGGTSGTLASLVPAGSLDELPSKLFLPEATDLKVWMDGKLQYCDKDGKYILIQVGTPSPGVVVNPEFVKQSEMQSFRDILNPKWKGKMSFDDPTTPGNGARWFRSVAELMGMDYMYQLVKQEPIVIRNDRLRFEWLVRGKNPITLGIKTDLYAEFVKIGAPIASFYLREGAWMTGRGSGLSVVKKAPHPNAARVFINWLLTKEGQTIYSRASRTQSLRIDVSYDHLLAEEVRQPGAKYIMVENETYLDKDPEYRNLAKDIFKGLMQ